MTCAPASRRAWRHRLAAVALSTLLSSAVAEVAVRRLGVEHEDGAFTLDGRLVSAPWPAAKHDELLARMEGAKPPLLIADRELGWTLNPVATPFHDGLYWTNGDGFRSGPDRATCSRAPAAGVQRIVLLGDSFTYGEELPFEATWGRQLERALAAAGRASEVINLGVGGYGMDQALLRFRRDGAALRPAVVIFGLQTENVFRNLNVVRMFYFRASDFPFTKPRFLVDDGDERLALVNVPALAPDELNRMLHDGSARRCDALRHDRFAPPFLAPARPWRGSRFLTLIESFAGDPAPPTVADVCRDPRCEGARVALAIVAAMAREVEAIGARLVIVHLPTLWRDAAQWAPFLAEVAARHPVVRTDDALRAGLLDAGKPLRNPDGSHYSAEACAIVARVLADHLAAPR